MVARVGFESTIDIDAHSQTSEVNLSPKADNEAQSSTKDGGFGPTFDLLWHQWRSGASANVAPSSAHLDKANMVRFSRRQVDAELTGENAFNDVKAVLEFLLSADNAIGESVGLDASPGEEAATT